MKVSNRWNRIIYRFWAPIYDGSFDRFFVSSGRMRALALLNPKSGERILLVGVGTGADLPLLPPGICAVGIDLSPQMLMRAHSKLPLPGREVSLVQSDAQESLFVANCFDAAVLNLVLSVVPDGASCLHETLRALKPGGRAVIFDKFLPDHGTLTRQRYYFNAITKFFGTDITRRFGELAAGNNLIILDDEPSLLNGAYRILLVKRSLRGLERS